MPRKHDAHKDELEGVAQRLRNERPQASPLDLDRIKTTAMSRAQAGTGRGRVGARRLAVASLTVGLLAAGTGGVLASKGSGQTGNAAVAQYGSQCDVNNGGNNTGSGNGNGNGNGDGNGNGNSKFASFHDSGKGKSSGSSNNSSGNGNGNGTENGNGNGTGNGNGSGNEDNNFNCNENSFNETTIDETNTTTNNITNTYSSSTVTVVASPTTATGAVQGTTTTKPATSKHPVKFHINISKKSKLKKVTLKINGKVVSVLKGKKASANISIANLPCSAQGTTVTVTAVTTSGKTITQSHTYHICV
ncbi:MAG TPA: hypothetical protein VIJ39_09455 [Solirubrobacteraceae bacterium]